MTHRLLTLIALLSIATAARATPPLPHLGADANAVTVSGLSSGAFMAVQYGVAFSATTTGVGVVAGGPYGCVRAQLSLAQNPIENCMNGQRVSGAASIDVVRAFDAYGWIDPPVGIAAQRVYLFHGSTDHTVEAPTMAALRDFYRGLGVPGGKLVYLHAVKAGHAFLSPSGTGCAAEARPPYVQRCPARGTAYDQPGAILAHVLGRSLAPRVRQATREVQAFAQPSATGLAATGYLYVPRDCEGAGARCSVHVVFHGCAQSATTAGVGDAVYRRLGFNEWADGNRLIVLYPQIEANGLAGNPYGCWDWWGYSTMFTSRYLDRRAPQLAAVRRMVEELALPAD